MSALMQPNKVRKEGRKEGRRGEGEDGRKVGRKEISNEGGRVVDDIH